MAKNKSVAAEQTTNQEATETAKSANVSAEATATAESAGGNQGSAVTLPNGERRIDYIRRRFYDEGAKRGDIRREINEMLEKAGQADKKIAYQIVFAATKHKEDPRKPKAAPATPAAEASAQDSESSEATD